MKRLVKFLILMIVTPTTFVLFVVMTFKACSYFNSPIKKFSRATSLSINSDKLEVVLTGDTHGGFGNDGAFYIILKVERDVVNDILRAKPPWGKSKWQSLPFPIPVIACAYCGYENGVLFVRKSEFSSDKSSEIIYSVKSTNLFFVARDNTKNPSNSRKWDNAELLIIDKTSSTIWYSEWDY